MLLTCPRDGLLLTNLTCPDGHKYLAFEGIPVLLRDDVPETLWIVSHSLKVARGEEEVYRGDYVSEFIGAAAGTLYKEMIGKVEDYPIPDIPVNGTGMLLDVGCNWGRWTIAAARKGYQVVGIDANIDAVCAAQRVCESLNIDAQFICADARYLPFPDRSFDQAFSFSVLQHFSKSDARLAFNEMRRVAHHSTVQMAGKYGIRALQTQIKTGFSEPSGFNVRYWTPSELKTIGQVLVHCYFGTGILPSDLKYLPWKYRMVVHLSEILTRLSKVLPPLRTVADSYYVEF